MIALDLCQPHYQTLLTICQEFTKKNAKHEWKEKKVKSECDFIGFKNNKLNYRCKECEGRHFKSISESIKNFSNMHQCCNGDLNNFFFLLRKGVYRYECMYSWERFNETSLPNKKAFYSELNLEFITDKDYAHAQKVWEVFKIKNFGEYHNLYVQCDTLLLADVFQNFRDKCTEIYELGRAHFLPPPGLGWQAC